MPENKSTAEINLKNPVTRLINYCFKRFPDGLDEASDVVKNDRLGEISEAVTTSALFSFLAPMMMLAAVGAFNEYREVFEEFEELEKEKEHNKEHLLKKMCAISDRCRNIIAVKCNIPYHSIYKAPDISKTKDLAEAAAMVAEYNSLQNEIALNSIEKRFGWTELVSLCANAVGMSTSLTASAMTLHEEYSSGSEIAKEGLKEGGAEATKEAAEEGLKATAELLETIATNFFIAGQALMIAESGRNFYVARKRLKDLGHKSKVLNKAFEEVPPLGKGRNHARPVIDKKTKNYLNDLRKQNKRFIKWGQLYPSVATGAGSVASITGLVLAPSGLTAGIMGVGAGVIFASRFVQNEFRSKERRFNGVKADKFPVTKAAVKNFDVIKLISGNIENAVQEKVKSGNSSKNVLVKAYENSAATLGNSLQNANKALVLSKLSSLIFYVKKKGGGVAELESFIDKISNHGVVFRNSKTHSGIIQEVKDGLKEIVANKENKGLLEGLFSGEKDDVSYKVAKFSCEVAKYLEKGVANNDLISLNDLFKKTSRAVISDKSDLLLDDKTLLSIGIRPEKNPKYHDDANITAAEFASTVIEHTKTASKNIRKKIADRIYDLSHCLEVNKELEAQEKVASKSLDEVAADIGYSRDAGGKWVKYIKKERSEVKVKGFEVSV